MSRFGSHRLASVLLVLGLTLFFLASSQAAESGRRGFGMMRGSFLGMLAIEQVQQDLKLSDEEKTKVQELGEKLREEMRESFSEIRQLQDRQQQRAKMTELTDQMDEKARTALRDVLSREQMMRLFQIRLQVRGAVYGLNSRRAAERLQLTEEQKTKAAELDKTTQDKIYAALSDLRDIPEDQRRAKWAEVRENTSKIRREADEQALGMLTAEQREAFQKMQGEKLELPNE